MSLAKTVSRRLSARIATENVTSAGEMPSRQFEYGLLGGMGWYLPYLFGCVLAIGGLRPPTRLARGKSYSAAWAAGFFGGKRP